MRGNTGKRIFTTGSEMWFKRKKKRPLGYLQALRSCLLVCGGYATKPERVERGDDVRHAKYSSFTKFRWMVLFG